MGNNFLRSHMEKKILIGMAIIGIILLLAIGVMTYILLTREAPVEKMKSEQAEVEEVVEPPPLEEEALLKATKVVGERLRVFDVEEHQLQLLADIKESLSSGMNDEEKKQVIESVVNSRLTVWKDQVIRDTLIELYGEYSTEDYESIDDKTNISKLREFVIRFEMEILGIN